MKGAILGDIIGSRFELTRIPVKKDEFELFTSECCFTDDTVLTIATMDALINNKTFEHAYYEWSNKYPERGYGENFKKWMNSKDPKPYNSCGNASAMRAAPVGILAKEIMESVYLGYESALPTHNHISGLKGASAVAVAVFLAKEKKDKKEIISTIQSMFGYNLERKLSYVQPYYYFSDKCEDSVPESIMCFLEGSSWEDTIRNAVWLNGDADTMCAISGAIAEMYYGIPADYEYMIYRYLPTEMIEIINEYYARAGIK